MPAKAEIQKRHRSWQGASRRTILNFSTTQLTKNLVVSWEAVRFMFRVDQVSIHDNVKDATATLDHLRIDTRRFTNCVRQTGGLRGVVSLHAVSDADFHPEFLRCLNHCLSESAIDHAIRRTAERDLPVVGWARVTRPTLPALDVARR
jgi:hypothetical protein